MIYGSKIFYIGPKQLDNGILDMEELAELIDDPKRPMDNDQKMFVQGPYIGDDGSFTVVYKVSIPIHDDSAVQKQDD